MFADTNLVAIVEPQEIQDPNFVYTKKTLSNIKNTILLRNARIYMTYKIRFAIF